MKNLTLEFRVSEEGKVVKDVAISVVLVGAEGEQKCQPVVFIKDAKSGFETTVKLPEGEHCSLRNMLENIANQKLDAVFVLALLRRIGFLFN